MSVSVNEEEDFGGSFLDTKVSLIGDVLFRTGDKGKQGKLGAEFLGNEESFVGGFGVNDDDFKIVHGLVLEVGEEFGEVLGLV